MTLRAILALDIILLFVVIAWAASDKPTASVIQGTPYTSPTFDFDVEQGEINSKVLLCKPSASDTKHLDHTDRIVRLVCEDGRVVLKLNNVEFPEGFMLKVAPARQ